MADEPWEHPPVSRPLASQEVEIEMQKTEGQHRQEVTFADSAFDSPLNEACQDTPTNTEDSVSMPLLTSQKSRRQEKVRGPCVIGSVIRHIICLPDIHVNQIRNHSKAQLTHVKDNWTCGLVGSAQLFDTFD